MNANLILSWAQTLGVVAALLFTAYELHSRTREQKFRNYVDATSGALDLARLMVENKDLQALYTDSPDDSSKTYNDLTPDEKTRVLYCDLVIALCETVWVASKEGWLPKDEWQYWQVWVDWLKKSKDFRWTLRWDKNDYDPEFLKDLGVHALAAKETGS
jgi:hypothetical protein